MMTMRERVEAGFRSEYGEDPKVVVRAPGRVNLIGEHTDYNDGFVLPMAIDRAAWIALRPRTDRKVRLKALDFEDDLIAFDMDVMALGDPGPAEYIKGVAWALANAGYMLTGWDGVMGGDVPIGAGLSSSAALELATARAFAAVSGFAWNAPRMAKLCQKAENEWVGVQCGIMDQMISACGEDGHALLIDCRSLETQPAPVPPGTVVVVLDTGTRRGLVGSAYNERRTQCFEAARFFGVAALRDLTRPDFEARAAELDPITRSRARHVVTENERTLRAIDAMRAGDAAALGDLMDASHASLRDDFEVSSDALNTIVSVAREHAACIGARMTGGGFGGCAVALVRADDADDFVTHVDAVYRERTQHVPQIYVCRATAGAAVVP
jgi:galactokinase